jgi:hypothetical protein
MMGEMVELPDISVPMGLYSLADLPQRGSVAKQAFGVGWPELDEIFRFYLGQFIVVTGIAGHGKSTFMLNAMMKLALDRAASDRSCTCRKTRRICAKSCGKSGPGTTSNSTFLPGSVHDSVRNSASAIRAGPHDRLGARARPHGR